MSSWFDLPSLGHPLLRKNDENHPGGFTDDGGIPRTVENLSNDFSKSIFKESLPYMSLERLKGGRRNPRVFPKTVIQENPSSLILYFLVSQNGKREMRTVMALSAGKLPWALI